MHISDELRSKLDSKSKPCIFVGYGDEEFGYRLWDPINKKIYRSRDVVFRENQTYEDLEGESVEPQRVVVDSPFSVSPQPVHYDDLSEVHDDDAHSEDEQNHEFPPFDYDQQHDDDVNEEEDQEPNEEVIEAMGLRRSNRVRAPSTKYSPNEYVLLTSDGEPESFEEVQSHKDKSKWLKAMQEEMDSLYKNHTYDLVTLPNGRKALKNKWVFKLKNEGDGKLRYKARLVVKGFGQKKGVDYDEIFSPVVKHSSIKVVLGLAASMDLEVEQLDVKTAFLHGDLDEEIYMEQPSGFEVEGKEHMVCRLRKSLYGLKQAPRSWYKKFDAFMGEHGYQRSTFDHCVYFKRFSNGEFIILLLYVDDMLIVGKNANMICKLKEDLSKSFDMKDLGAAKQMLGMTIKRDRNAKKLWLSQEKYIERVLEKFHMKDAKPVATPLANHFKLSSKECPSSKEEKDEMSKIPYASVVGSLMYAMICTRPDIAHAVGLVSRFLSNPGRRHWEAVKWILRYLKGTSKVCLCYGNGKPELEGFTDSDYAGDLDSRKSTSGYVFTFFGGAISWQSRLQKIVALSTTEAEYVAATEACKEMLWLKRFLIELGITQKKYVVKCDSQSAIDLSKNATFHSRTKHIEVRYHWIRDVLERRLMGLDKVHTDSNPSDMMTKALTKEKHEFFRNLTGMSTLSI